MRREEKKIRAAAWKQLKQQPHHLYRHFDKDGRLLYVGISLHTLGRLRGHRTSSEWFGEVAEVKIERFSNRDEAAQAERLAIASENPTHNRKRPRARREGSPCKKGAQKEPQMTEAKRAVRRMLTIEQVLRLVPDGKPATLMRMIESGEFPGARYISPNKRVWFDDEIDRWNAQPPPSCSHIAPSAPIPAREARSMELGPTLEPRP